MTESRFRTRIGLIDQTGPQAEAAPTRHPGPQASSPEGALDESEAAAFAKLNEQFGALFHTEDLIEGRKAEAEGRPPVYQGK